MIIENIRINLLYSSSLGNQRFGDENFTIAQNDSSAGEFLNVIGGIEFITSRHFIFLQLLQYEEVNKFVSFLVRYLIENFYPKDLMDYFLYTENINSSKESTTVLFFLNGEKVEFIKNDTQTCINFLSEQKIFDFQKTLYFQNICIKNDLIESAIIDALEQYFVTIENILRIEMDSNLNALHDNWKNFLSFRKNIIESS